jgi:hypothetical protein
MVTALPVLSLLVEADVVVLRRVLELALVPGEEKMEVAADHSSGELRADW